MQPCTIEIAPRGECFAAGFGVPAVYDGLEEVLRLKQLDFIDTVTYPFTFGPV